MIAGNEPAAVQQVKAEIDACIADDAIMGWWKVVLLRYNADSRKPVLPVRHLV